jgi:hypothetical protein
MNYPPLPTFNYDWDTLLLAACEWIVNQRRRRSLE